MGRRKKEIISEVVLIKSKTETQPRKNLKSLKIDKTDKNISSRKN
jgi:hypothetical protein